MSPCANVCVCVCVYVCVRVSIIWSLYHAIHTCTHTHIYTHINKGYSFYMTAVIVIGGRHNFRTTYVKCVVETNLIRASYRCVSHYFHINIPLNNCTQATRWSALIIKVDLVCLGVLEVFKRRAGLGYT